LDQAAAIAIRSSIERARGKLRLHRIISRVIKVLAASLLAVLTIRFAAIYFDTAIDARRLLIVGSVMTVLALFVFVFYILRSTKSDPSVTALWRYSSDPSLEELLLSALELASSHTGTDVNDTTQGLIELQLKSVLKRLNAADTRSMFPSLVDGRARVILAVVTCMSIGTLRIDDFWNSNVKLTTMLTQNSWVKGLTLTVQPPSYTELPEKKYENTDGHITALQGSKVTATGFVELPEGHELRVGLPNKELRPVTVTKNTVDFEFEISQSGPWHFEVYDTSQKTGVKETTARRITATPDKAPKVVVNKPSKDLTVAPSALIQLVYQASDDFRLSRSTLVIALDGDLEQAERVDLDTLSTKKTRGAEELDLSLFDIQGGDRVAVFIECKDAKMPTPQVGRSKALYLTIESSEDEHQALTMELKKLIEPLLTDLADRLEFDLKKQSINAFIGLNERASQTTSKAATLVDKLADDPLTPKAVLAVIQTTLGKLQNALLGETRKLSNWRTAPKMVIKVTPNDFAAIIEHTEAMVIALEAAVARLSLEDMKALTEQIRVRRARIQDLLSSYKDKPNTELKNRILRNIKRLKQKMEQLREKLAQLRQKLPEEFLNLEGLKGSELSEAMTDGEQKLDDLEKMLEDGQIDEAMKALDALSDSLDAFDQLVDKDMETLHNEGDPKRQQAISELMDKTRDIMKKQQELLEQTRANAKKGQAAFDEALNEKDGRPLDEIAAGLVQTEQQINELRTKKRNPRRQDRLSKLSEETGSVLDALERENLPRAIENIEEALESSRRITWDRNGPDHKMDRKINESLRQARKAMKELLSKARNAQKKAQDGDQTKALSKAQQALKEKLDQLGEEMGEKGQEVPGLDGPPGESLEAAGASMNKAKQSLEQSQPGQAPPSQVEAMNALEQTMQNLRQASKPKPAQREGQGHSRKEKVEIPSGEDYAAPSAFREDLLKAMKRKTDDANQDAVKRYYRSLVE
jgi:hypothetical protein